MKKILLVLLVITLPMLIGCEKEVLSEGYPEMEAFYTESCGLMAVTTDSVKLFSAKVDGFTIRNPESKEHSLYPKIQANIKSASLGLIITCDTTWDGETHINF